MPQHLPHLRAATIALVATFVLLGLGELFAHLLENHYINQIAPEPFSIKNQGIVLQKETFRHPDILPIYGSSELIKPIPNKASEFFRNKPTGFEVSPVGKAGTTSLIILQKIAACGNACTGRKVVISISPGWFFTEAVKQRYYEGNFSAMQANEVIFNSQLDAKLKRAIAIRMSEFPHSLERTPMLAMAIKLLAKGGFENQCLYDSLVPLGRLQNFIYGLQDHFEVCSYILQGLGQKKWAREEDVPPPEGHEELKAKTIDRILGTINNDTQEWSDLQLLLEALRQLKVKALLLSMPLNGKYYDEAGIPLSVRNTYYARIRRTVNGFGYPLIDFSQVDEDPAFLKDEHDHLNVKGWQIYDKVIDAFYHENRSALSNDIKEL